MDKIDGKIFVTI